MHDAAFWSVAGPAVAIINCCIVTLRPLLRLVSPARLWTSNKGSSKDRTGNSGGSGFGKRLMNKVGSEHDEYPLTRIEDGISNTVVASGAKGDAESEDSSGNYGACWEGQRRPDDGKIHVQHEYNIRKQTGGSL
jgi:hypothetical protein